MVRGASLPSSASTISGWRARRRSSVALVVVERHQLGRRRAQIDRQPRLGVDEVELGQHLEVHVDARQLILDEPRQLGQDPPLLLRHFELGQLRAGC